MFYVCLYVCMFLVGSQMIGPIVIKLGRQIQLDTGSVLVKINEAAGASAVRRTGITAGF